MKRLFLSLFFLLLSITKSQATHFQVNNEHSKLKFKIEYMGLSKVEGRFKDYKIYFQYDEKTKTLSEIKAIIEASSIDTDDKKRDAHLRKKDFFETQKYPEIKIWSESKLKVTKEQDLEVNLMIQIKDIKNEIPVSLLYKGKRKDPITEKIAYYFTLNTELKRSDYEITWNKKLDNGGFLLSDNVSIEVEIEAYPIGEKPAFSRFFTPDKSDIQRVEVDFDQKNVSDTKKNNNFKIIPKKEDESRKSEEQRIFTLKNLTITFFTGFSLFLFMIAISFYGQKYVITFLESKGLSERSSYIITNTVIMIIVIIIAIYAAPYMGWGPNPLTKAL